MRKSIEILDEHFAMIEHSERSKEAWAKIKEVLEALTTKPALRDSDDEEPGEPTSFEVSPSKKLEYWEPACGLPIPVTQESVQKGHDLGLNDGCGCIKPNKKLD